MRTTNLTKMIVVALVAATQMAFAQFEDNEIPEAIKAAKTKVFVPLDNARLFSVPTADVISNMDVVAEGGGFLGKSSQSNSLVGNLGYGLGDVAQVNVSADEIVSTVRGRTKAVGVAAFKLRLIKENGHIPSVAFIANRSFKTPYAGFSMNEVNIASVMTKRFFNERITLTGGVNVALSTLNPDPDSVYQFVKKEPLHSIHPMIGMSIRANPRTYVMMELQTEPMYNASELTAFNLKDAKVSNIYHGGLGVRYYFTSWLSLDTGTRLEIWPDEYNLTLKGKMNVAIPVRTIVKRTANMFN